MKFNVRFTINRFPLRNMYRSIETVGKGFIFPTETTVENYDVEIPRSFFNRDIEQNQEQKLAVRICILITITHHVLKIIRLDLKHVRIKINVSNRVYR